MSDANTILMGGGLESAKFPAVGTQVSGRITRPPEARQQTDMDTGEPLVFANGDPRMQVVVNLQTAERDPAIPDDKGERALYVKGNMLVAVREAVRKAGAEGLEVGGTLTVAYTGDGEPKKRGFNAPKLYAAQYQRPSAGNAALMGNVHQTPSFQSTFTADGSTAPAAPAVAHLPVYEPQAANATLDRLAQQRAEAPAADVPPPPPGIAAEVWARMAPEQRNVVLQAVGAAPPF